MTGVQTCALPIYMNLKYLRKEAKYYKKVDGSLKRIVTKFLLAKTPLRRLVNSKLYNKIYKKKIKRGINKRPYILSIENTNICNAKCIMCPHVKMKRKQRVMNQKDFEKIVNNVMAHEKPKFITITGFGEPLADKHLDGKIKWLNNKYPDLKIIIFTNASLLDKKLTEKLLKLKIFKLNFSINGTRKNYNRIMGLDYEDTMKKINYFLKRKKELKNKILMNASLMILDDNKKDIKQFIDYWMEKMDSVMAYLPSDWAGEVEMVVKTPFKNKRWPCMTLWKFVTVDVDGNAIMCCRDYESKFKLGNLIKEDYNKIKDKINIIKKQHLKMNFSRPICKSCDNSFDSSLDWWE